MTTTSDQAAIRALIEDWASAIRNCDIDGIVASHDPAIVMFDVPPPYDGIRGADEYTKAWPPFFEYVRSGAEFEIVELHVVAGDDVGFAYGLLRCGTPEEFAENPDNRLRLTMGLHKRGGRWLIAHEHHSFPITD